MDTKEISKSIVKELEENGYVLKKKNNPGTSMKQIIAGLITIAITGGIGSYIGVKTTIAVDREKIKQNTKLIHTHKEETKEEFRNVQVEFDNIEESISEVEDENWEQWKEIYKVQEHKTRGGGERTKNYINGHENERFAD